MWSSGRTICYWFRVKISHTNPKSESNFFGNRTESVMNFQEMWKSTCQYIRFYYIFDSKNIWKSLKVKNNTWIWHKKFYYCTHLYKNSKFVSYCTPLNETITYIRLLKKNSTVLPQIAHLREIVLLEGQFLVKLSLSQSRCSLEPKKSLRGLCYQKHWGLRTYPTPQFCWCSLRSFFHGLYSFLGSCLIFASRGPSWKN